MQIVCIFSKRTDALALLLKWGLNNDPPQGAQGLQEEGGLGLYHWYPGSYLHGETLVQGNLPAPGPCHRRAETAWHVALKGGIILGPSAFRMPSLNSWTVHPGGKAQLLTAPHPLWGGCRKKQSSCLPSSGHLAEPITQGLNTRGVEDQIQLP